MIKIILKKFIIAAAIFAVSLGLTACGGDDATHVGAFTLEEIQDDPASFVGEVTLTGIVGTAETRDFSIQNESGTFEVGVDYNGNQALPQLGEEVVVEGTLTENRPCCGPGFTISITSFDLVGE